MHVCMACCLLLMYSSYACVFCIVIIYSLIAKYVDKFMYFCLYSCMYIYSAREEQ